MPFPWKKVKSAKISRLVNDHLHISQKRRDGSSLVVETGFPTSLIDLFIKNREKLKKSSRRKRLGPILTPITDANDPGVAEAPGSVSSPLTPPIAGSLDPPINCPSDVQPSLPNCSLSPLSSRDSGEIPVVGSNYGDACAGAKRVLFLFLKMFVVVFLALGMKRLTVGITISAFFLLFLEFLGKRMRGMLRKSSDSKGALSWMIPRVCLLLRFKKVSMPELEKEHTLKPVGVESRCHTHGTQIAEAMDYLTRVEEIQSEDEIMAESSTETMFRCQKIEYEGSAMEKEDPKCEVLETKMIKSRRAKIKLKMKKFFRKKSKSRKEQEPQRLEIVKEVALCDKEKIDQCWEDIELQSVPELSSVSSARKSKEEDPLWALGGLSEINEETTTKNQEKSTETKLESMWIYLVLCLVVLLGLIGGRAFALLLTLSWYFLLKLGEKLPIYIKTG